MVTLKGGVLSFTIFISTVVSSILLMIILLGYYHSIEKSTFRQRIDAIDNIRSVEEWSLAMAEQLPYDEPIPVDIFQDGQDTGKVVKTQWGLMDLIQCESSKKDFKVNSMYFAGWQQDQKSQSALYLVDEGRPLSLTGDAHINGDAFLPLSGVQSAYISRVGYTRGDLIYGIQYQSKKEIPELNQDLEQVFKTDFPQPFASKVLEVNIRNSFDSDSIYWISGIKRLVTDTLKGKILLEVKELTFDSMAHTEDILAVAGTIEFDSGFVGSGQFFAKDTIIVRSGVRLDYPSVLATEGTTNLILIEPGAEITGMIVMEGESFTFRQRLLEIKEGSTINGMVYVNGMTTHYGTINGHLTTRKFLVNNFSGVFENYLFNGVLDAEELDTAFLASNTWFTSERKGVMKWLN